MEAAKYGKPEAEHTACAKALRLARPCLNNRTDGEGAEAELVMGRRRS